MSRYTVKIMYVESQNDLQFGMVYLKDVGGVT
jgi:hypothetical protein